MSVTLSFDAVTSPQPPGGTFRGSLVIVTDREIPWTDVKLSLRGSERWVHAAAHATAWGGSTFLDMAIPLLPTSVATTGGFCPQGTTTLPFEVTVPPDAHFSVMTDAWKPSASCRDEEPRGDGLFVFYVLEARILRKLIGDVVHGQLVEVLRPSALLGTIPREYHLGELKGVQAQVRFNELEVVAGGRISGDWRILNPTHQILGTLRIGVARRIDVCTDGLGGGGAWTGRFWMTPEAAQEGGPAVVEAGAGQFNVNIPDSFREFRNDRAAHFQALWVVFVAIPSLSTHFGGGVDFLRGHILEIPLTPPDDATLSAS